MYYVIEDWDVKNNFEGEKKKIKIVDKVKNKYRRIMTVRIK